MNLAEGFNGRLSRALDAFRIGNVAGDSANLRSETAQAFGGFAQGIRLDVRKHHIHALLCEGSPERETDATRTTGHEYRLACEYVHDDLPGDRSPLARPPYRRRIKGRNPFLARSGAISARTTEATQRRSGRGGKSARGAAWLD